MRMGAAKIATGHYARVREREGRFELLKGLDETKDQSYFLHRLTQAQLSKAMFPVGEIRKTEVRRLAEEARLPNHAKKDSTGICFIGERPFREFLERYLPRKPGEIITEDGKVIGQHQGLMYYTLGQRQGLGIGGTRDGDGTPWFVAQKLLDDNKLVVVQGHDHPLLLKHDLAANDAAWIAGIAPADTRNLAAKTRYRQQDAACSLAAANDHDFALSFRDAQWAVTPGQSAVIYQGEVCLGGGIIA
jgi:tRNA-uridine 2-sulfurtransferase